MTDRRQLREEARRRYGGKAAVRDRRDDGWCDGVPELDHPPHNGAVCEIDHIVPRILGGKNCFENLRSICLPVHEELTRLLNFHRQDGGSRADWIWWQAQYGVVGEPKT